MKRKLFFILISLFFFADLTAQVAVPANSLITSEFERNIIGLVDKGESVSPFRLLLSVNYDLDNSPFQYEDKYLDYLGYLSEKKEKGISQEDFLRLLYYRTHKKFLKQYTAHTSFASLLESGNYDCLSATILYALMLHEFGFDFQIAETDYHIYLIVESGEGRIMMESTDPLNGFISDEEEINARIREINDRNESLSEQYLTFQEENRYFSSFFKLTGLLYFNASVEEFNNNNIIAAVDQLEKARFYDDAKRFKTFGKFLARELVSNQDIDEDTRTRYLIKLTRFLNSGIITASL